jgi:hypothetical protein
VWYETEGRFRSGRILHQLLPGQTEENHKNLRLGVVVLCNRPRSFPTEIRSRYLVNICGLERNFPMENRTTAEAVNRRLPTAAAWARSQVSSCEICGRQSGTGAGFLRVPRFSLPALTAPTAPHSSSSIIWDWYNRPNSGRSANRTQSHSTQRN